MSTRIFFLLVLVVSAFPSVIDAQEVDLAPPAEAKRDEAGLVWMVVKEPTGTAVPTLAHYVTLDYTGWNMDGEVVDSTAKHPDQRIFNLSRLFPGLQQMVATMKTGEKRRIWIPEELGPKRMPVVFDVELVEISQPFEAPPDVAAPPADAEKSGSGLAWKILKPSTAVEHPKANSTVVVHYTGWTVDGEMIDSSVMRGQASTFPLDGVIGGWQEGLRLMVPGERRRFWVPAKLAYRGQRGKPQGMLVFDIELLRIEPRGR